MTDSPPPSLPDLSRALEQWIEPWMEVLMVGLSAELLGEADRRVTLSTARPGGRISGGPWDAVCLRLERVAEPAAIPAWAQHLDEALARLRAGGLAVVVTAEQASPSDLDPTQNPLLQAHVIERQARLANGVCAWLLRRQSTGQCDLVGLRRALNRLELSLARVPAVLELATSGAGTAELERRAKLLIGRLADRDRFGYLVRLKDPHAVVSRGAVERPGTEHLVRTLLELSIRFQHFRAQSQAYAHGMVAEQWASLSTSLDGQPISLAQLIRAWADEEEAALDEFLPAR